MVYLFKAFLKLPFLKKFVFSTSSLNREEWDLFEHFIEKQNRIEELDLNVRKEFYSYFMQNDNLRSTLKRLKSHQSLTSLSLYFSYFSVEALSQSLSCLKMMNQLHTLKFKVCDDIFNSQTKASDRVEGLCQFLKNHKRSLKVFHMTLKLALEDILVTQIAEAVSHLSEVKDLYFECNWSSSKRLRYFRKTFQRDIDFELQRKFVLPRIWNPNLAEYFQKLVNLEKFVFLSQMINTVDKDPVRWVIDLISILPNLERLKNLKFYFDPVGDVSFRKARPMLINAFLCIPRIKKIFVKFYDPYNEPLSKELDLKEICEIINQRQALKSDFMFD